MTSWRERTRFLSNSVLYEIIRLGMDAWTLKEYRKVKEKREMRREGEEAEKKRPMIRLDYVLT